MDAFVSLKRKSDDISPASVAPASSAAAAKAKSAAVLVPADLSALSNEQLQGLVRDLDEERQALRIQLAAAAKAQQNNAKKARKPAPISTSSAASAAAATPTVVTPTAKEVTMVQKRLGKNVERSVKKLTFGNRKKPTCEVSEGGMSPEMATALMKEYSSSLKSDTKKMTKWLLTDDADIAALFQTKRLIHPCKFNGKVWSFGGTKPKIYVWAGYEQCEVKYDKSQRNLTIKVKCFEAGTGSPDSPYSVRLVAYADGIGPKPDGNAMW